MRNLRKNWLGRTVPVGMLLRGAVTCAGLLAATEASAAPSSTSTEQGFEMGEVQHPRSIAMGGASEVWGGSTTAVFVNPANLPLYRVYHLEGLATFGPEARRQSYGGAVVDSSTSRLAGGFGGTWSQMDPDGIKRQWTDLRLTLAYPITDRISFGVTARYFRLSQGITRGPLGPSLASDGTATSPIVSAFTFDAGIAAAITQNLRVALSGRNLTDPNNGLAPTALAGGVGWSNQNVTVEADYLADFTTYAQTKSRAMVGAEALVADHVPVRLGYRYDGGTQTNALSAGLVYVDSRFSIDLGGRRDIAGDHPATTVSLGIRIFIDSMGAFGNAGGSGSPNDGM